jgi:CheY-like chemotaxis protein
MAKRVLIVDDTTTVRMFVNVILKHEGFELDEATTGLEALERVEKNRPDLILMDINMPEMDGLEACRRLKGDPHTSGIPIIVVTLQGEREQVERAYSAGCDDYLTKPIKKIELLSKITRVLGH